MDSNHVTQPPYETKDLRLAALLGAAESDALSAESAAICSDLLSWLDASPLPLSRSVRHRIVEIVTNTRTPGKGASAEGTTVFRGETRDDALRQVAHALFPETDGAGDVQDDDRPASNRLVAIGGRRFGDAGRNTRELLEVVDSDSQTEEAMP